MRDKYSKQFGVPPDRIVVSKTLLTRIIGVDAKTIDAWNRDTPPLPSLVRGQQKPNRVEWVYDLKQVIEWIRDRAYRNGMVDAATSAPASGLTIDPETGEAKELPDHLMSKEEAHRQIAIIDLKERRRDHLIGNNQLVYIDQAEAILGQVLGNVSERLRMMMTKTIARLVRAGWDRPVAEDLIQTPVYEMLDDLQSIDISVDPLEADEEAAAAAKIDEDEAGVEMKEDDDAGAPEADA